MKKVVFLLGSLQGGGAERITVNILNNLPDNKYRISLVLLNRKGECGKFIKAGIDVYDLNAKLEELNLFNNITKIGKIVSLFRRLDPDIVFSNGSYCNFLSIIARAFSNRKIRLNIRETNLVVSMQKGKPLGIIKMLGFFSFYPHADTFVAPSQAVINDFKKVVDFKKTKTVVLPNFIDPTFIDKMVCRQADVSFVKSINDKPVIISVARLVWQKDYTSSLLAFEKVFKDIPCYYWILGQGPLENQLKGLAKKLGIQNRVRFFGFQQNPYAFLSQAKIFFSTSLAEGFPNALLEAMYMGLPAVVTRFNSSVQEIITNKREGFIVEKCDINQMAEALKVLLMDVSLYDTMKKNALTRAENYSVRRVIPQVEQIL